MAKTKIEQLRSQLEQSQETQEDQNEDQSSVTSEQETEETTETEDPFARIKDLEALLAQKLASVSNMENILANRISELTPPTETQQEKARKDPNYLVESVSQGHEQAKDIPHVVVLPLESGAHCLGPVIYNLTKGVRTPVAYPLAVQLAAMTPPLVTLVV